MSQQNGQQMLTANAVLNSSAVADPHPVPTLPIPSRRYVPTTSDAAASFSARSVVAQFVRTRSEAGVPTTTTQRAILGRYARELIRDTRWDAETVLEAVRTFATSRRHPRFLAEWVATVFNRASLSEHRAHTAEKFSVAPEVMAAMFSLKHMPDLPRDDS